MLRPWDRGTEHPSVSVFIHNLPFIPTCLQLKCWVNGMFQFGPAASSALLDDPAHCWGWPQPNYPSRWIKCLRVQEARCEQQYFRDWSSAGSRGQSKHAPAQERDSWSLRFFPGSTVTWWTETACFFEINLNFKHIHFQLLQRNSWSNMNTKKAESPDSRKQKQSLEWEKHRFGSWEKDKSWRGRSVCLCMWA